MHRRALSSTGCRRGTHYETLGLRREASPDQIKSAFFAMSKEHHPDIPDHKEKPQFHEITEAYTVLRDPVSRRAY
ncbi:DnaJ domain-containing protein, partial [Mycena vitilis]